LNGWQSWRSNGWRKDNLKSSTHLTSWKPGVVFFIFGSAQHLAQIHLQLLQWPSKALRQFLALVMPKEYQPSLPLPLKASAILGFVCLTFLDGFF
jgi:hypothetical protein